jgi:DNA-binding CsgD family transcriptional regulator/tetratricopeptide (TPR) repeat protein
MELLERASFLLTLAEYAAEARRGDGRLVLVSGESGMGKTALLEAFRDEARGVRWLWGACDGLLTPRPLGPIFDVAAQLDGELADLCHDGAHRDRLFAAFLREIENGDAFTVTVIEDAHWADEASIDLLSFLGRRLARMRALVLVTFREDELAADHPLRIVLGDLATQRATRRMRMPPLSTEAVRQLADASAPDVDAAELYRVTGGNPFYVREMLEAGWPSLPATVRDVVAARLARATADSRQVIEAAAIAGARIDPQLLMTALSCSAATIDACIATGILVPDGARLRFRHELVRLAVEAAIPPHRALELHARLLAELEARPTADPTVLAHHADGAGDGKAVLRHAPEAARRSSVLGAHRESAAHYERALRFASALAPADRAALHEGLAGECALLDRWDEAEAALRAALAIRRDDDDVRAIATDLRLMATTLWRLCRGAEAMQAALDAVQVLRSQPAGPDLAWAYAGLGIALADQGQRASGLQYIDLARDLGERFNQPDLLSFTVEASGIFACMAGEDGLPPIERALAIALEAGLPGQVGRAYTNLQEGAIALHRFDEADRYYADGVSFCDGRELGVYGICLTGWHAYALLLRARFDEAIGFAEGMLEHRGISPVNQLNPLRVLGAVHGRRGEPGAFDLLDRAAANAQRGAEPAWIVPIAAIRAELRWLLGEPDEATAEVRAARELADATQPYSCWSLAIWLRRLGLPDDLPASQPPEPFALELAGDWRGAAVAWERLDRRYDAAMVALAAGDEAALRGALEVFDELGAATAAGAARRRLRELGAQAVPRGPRPATRSGPAGLTRREQEVLALLVEGLADKEISRRLFISERTVHHHVSAVLAKVGVTSRSAAAVQAARLGIGTPA